MESLTTKQTKRQFFAIFGVVCLLLAINSDLLPFNPSQSHNDIELKIVPAAMNVTELWEKTTNNAQSITIEGNYAIVACGESGFTVYNISKPSQPTAMYTTSIPEVNFVKTYIKDNFLCAMTGGNGVYLYNFSASGNATYLATTGINYPITVDIFNNTLFVGDHFGGIEMFNMSDPENLQKIGNVPTITARKLKVKNGLLYQAGDHFFRIFNVSNPTAITSIFYNGSETLTGRDIELVEDLAIVNYWDGGIRIYNISNPQTPHLLNEIENLYNTIELSRYQHILYLSREFNGLTRINIQDPANPYIIDSLDIDDPQETEILNQYLYTITDTNRFKVFSTEGSDFDEDGIFDEWEHEYGLDPFNITDAMLDFDNDNLTNFNEFEAHSNPLLMDTDFDNLTDYVEFVIEQTNPASNDTDYDGLSDYVEIYVSFTLPVLNDTDEDGLSDFEEFRIYSTDPNAEDTDEDGISDFMELEVGLNPLNGSDGSADFDMDSVLNIWEIGNETDLWSNDTDGDTLPDAWEIRYQCNNSVNDSQSDPDMDSLTNYQEFLLGTDPNERDTDGDSIPDWWEVDYDLDPLVDDDTHDFDNDLLNNRVEYFLNTNPLESDSDGDGLPDGWEHFRGLDPLENDADEDLDNDGLSNIEEFQYSTFPNNNDSDYDGIADGYEVKISLTNPRMKDSDEDGISDFLEIYEYKTNPNEIDTDGDTLTDFAEIEEYQTNPNHNDSDHDGISDFDEIEQHSNPNSFINRPSWFWPNGIFLVILAGMGIIGGFSLFKGKKKRKLEAKIDAILGDVSKLRQKRDIKGALTLYNEVLSEFSPQLPKWRRINLEEEKLALEKVYWFQKLDREIRPEINQMIRSARYQDALMLVEKNLLKLDQPHLKSIKMQLETKKSFIHRKIKQQQKNPSD